MCIAITDAGAEKQQLSDQGLRLARGVPAYLKWSTSTLSNRLGSAWCHTGCKTAWRYQSLHHVAEGTERWSTVDAYACVCVVLCALTLLSNILRGQQVVFGILIESVPNEPLFQFRALSSPRRRVEPMKHLSSILTLLTMIGAYCPAVAHAQTNSNNQWYEFNKSSTVFIFVHGIFSSANSCWKAADGTYWPYLVKTDERLENPSIYLGGYYTDFSSGIYKVRDAANELLTNLTRRDLEGRPGPLSKRNIVFVAHSTGGLVVRAMLDKNRSLFKDKAIGIALYASPSRGSAWANRLRWLHRVFANEMAGELEQDSQFIDELDKSFASLISSKRLPRLTGIDLFENKFIVPGYMFRWFWPSTNVVGAEDSASYFGEYKIVPNTDHFNIVKPTSKTHMSHMFLVEFFDERFKPMMFPDDSDGGPPLPKPGTSLELEIRMVKGTVPIDGREGTHVGEGQGGVVRSLSIRFKGPDFGLTILRNYLVLRDTGTSNGGGPIMNAGISGEGDAAETYEFPMGVRGISLSLDGAARDKFDIVYKASLTTGDVVDGRNGSQVGVWHFESGSTQHQLVWLQVSVVAKR